MSYVTDKYGLVQASPGGSKLEGMREQAVEQAAWGMPADRTSIALEDSMEVVNRATNSFRFLLGLGMWQHHKDALERAEERVDFEFDLRHTEIYYNNREVKQTPENQHNPVVLKLNNGRLVRKYRPTELWAGDKIEYKGKGYE